MVLTIEEVALRLNMPVETVHRWIRQGKIPMQSNQGQYTIRQVMFDRWANEHQLKVNAPSPLPDVEPIETLAGLVLSAMETGGVFYDIGGDSKESLLAAAVDLIPNWKPTTVPLFLKN